MGDSAEVVPWNTYSFLVIIERAHEAGALVAADGLLAIACRRLCDMQEKAISTYRRKRLRRSIENAIPLVLMAGPLIALSLSGLFFSGRAIFYGMSPAAVSRFVFFVLLFGLVCWFGVVRHVGDLLACRIVPYFEHRVATDDDSIPDAFDGGIELASKCYRLDEVAAEVGVPPLSAYGFQDDYDGDEIIWHDPREALRTIDALTKAIRQQADMAAVVGELARLRAYLHLASQKGIRFCLLVRAGRDNMISPLEMDRRQGYFW